MNGQSAVGRRKLVIVPVVLLIFIILLVSLTLKLEGSVINYQDQVYVVRSLPSPLPDNEFEVALTVDFNEKNLPHAISIREHVPQGWILVTAFPRPTSSASELGLYTWNFSNTTDGYPIADATISYVVNPTGDSKDFRLEIVEYQP